MYYRRLLTVLLLEILILLLTPLYSTSSSPCSILLLFSQLTCWLSSCTRMLLGPLTSPPLAPTSFLACILLYTTTSSTIDKIDMPAEIIKKCDTGVGSKGLALSSGMIHKTMDRKTLKMNNEQRSVGVHQPASYPFNLLA